MNLTAPSTDSVTTLADTTLMDRERCDRCGAHAYVIVMLWVDGEQLSLSFCGHHYAANEVALGLSGATLRVDARDRLGTRETSAHA